MELEFALDSEKTIKRNERAIQLLERMALCIDSRSVNNQSSTFLCNDFCYLLLFNPSSKFTKPLCALHTHFKLQIYTGSQRSSFHEQSSLCLLKIAVTISQIVRQELQIFSRVS
jgi:hypothetical protein